MAEENPALFLQGGSHPAELVRNWMFWLYDKRPGILSADSFAVTEKSGTPDMSVDIAAGALILDGDEDADQRFYFCEARTSENLSIAAADPTNARIDLVEAIMEDAQYSGATNAWKLNVVTGTPSGTPAIPTASSNSFVLATVAVAALTSSILDANITDYRTTDSTPLGAAPTAGLATIAGGTKICTSTARPTDNLYEGLHIYETDTDRLYVYDGSTWVLVRDDGEWETATPTWVNVTPGTGGTDEIRYKVQGKLLHWAVNLVLGTGGSFTGTMSLATPASLVLKKSGYNMFHGIALNASPVARYVVSGWSSLSNNYLVDRAIEHGTANYLNSTAPFTWTNGDFLLLQGVAELN